MKNVLGPASGQVWNRTDTPPQRQKRSPWSSSEPDRSRVQPVDFETDNPQTAAESSGQVRNRTDPFRNQTAETPRRSSKLDLARFSGWLPSRPDSKPDWLAGRARSKPGRAPRSRKTHL